MDGADGQGRGGRRLHPMDVGSAAFRCGCGWSRWLYNAIAHGPRVSSSTSSCCRRLRVVHLEHHVEPKLRARPTYVLVEPPGAPAWHAQTATGRLQSPRARTPMAATRAFGHPRMMARFTAMAMETAYYCPNMAVDPPQTGLFSGPSADGRRPSAGDVRRFALFSNHAYRPALACVMCTY